MKSDEVIALEFMTKQFRVMQKEKEHGWYLADKWESRCDHLENVLSRLRSAHQPNSQGDCSEDGFSYPCWTRRVLDGES